MVGPPLASANMSRTSSSASLSALRLLRLAPQVIGLCNLGYAAGLPVTAVDPTRASGWQPFVLASRSQAEIEGNGNASGTATIGPHLMQQPGREYDQPAGLGSYGLLRADRQAAR